MLCAVAVDSASPTAASDVRADALFAAVQHRATAWAYPRYAAYDVAVTFSVGGKPVADSWKTQEDIAHAAVLTDIFSREDVSDPHTPHGINVDIPIVGHLSPPDKQRDPLGEVCLAADQTFGIAAPRHYAVVRDRQAFANVVEQYRVIGRTQSDRRRYALAILDSIGAVVHFSLTPLIDPRRDRLRELWVDTSSLMPLAAVVAGIGNAAPATQVRWRVDFVQKDGGVFIARETALAPLDSGRPGLLHDVVLRFDGLTLSSTYPFATSFGIATPVKPLADP